MKLWQILLAPESGVGNVVIFFADIKLQNSETLAALCDQKMVRFQELF